MPIYEYVCTKCKHDFEALQKVDEAPLTECPACHEAFLMKKVSASSFQLKGTGWYVTDFRDKKSQTTKTENKSSSSQETTTPSTEGKSTPESSTTSSNSEEEK